ncbi:MAG: glycosyltransferase family 39 protein, partial [Dehalococcoidia bacterium]|nr:glycosyltransferase family 39 protein [Dehalococcoidia bacterium]
MNSEAQAIPYPTRSRGLSGGSSRERALLYARRGYPYLPLFSVTLIALLLNAWGLSRAGYGNTYYAAAARSMTMSWKNFFFGAFDPGGFITVDKPPAFLWVGALSARIFGYSTWSILLPSAVAGAASVALLWLLVRRYFGTVAATVAGLVLALTPISVAVNRLNLPEPFLILLLLGAAAAVLRSLDSPRWWAWIAAAGALVGVAFNTKMLVGWMPGPAFVAAILVGVAGSWRVSWRSWLPRVALLGLVTFLVSASWLVAVDLWPTSQRPYIGGSSDNTVQDLVLNYNGIDRVEGTDQGFGNRPQNANGAGAQNNPLRGNPPAGAAPGGQPGAAGGQPGPANGAGGIIAGQPGPWRMFDAANGGQIAWFLPFAGLGALLALWSWRRDRLRRAQVLLWVGWVVTFGVIFSYAQGIYHSYYTSVMAPGIAALTGIGAVAAADLVRRERWWLAAAPAALVAAALAVQLKVAGRVPDFYGWLRPYAVVLAVAGLVVLAACLWRRRPPMIGLAVSIAGLLLLPAAWSFSETANASLNASLPQAGPRGGAAGRTFGSASFDDGTAALAQWLQANADPGARWQLVVSSSQNGSTLIAEYQVSVMAIGGFSGRDDAITADHFADLVASGDVRYVLATQQGFGGRGFTGPGAFGTNGGAAGGTLPNGAVPNATGQNAQGTTPGAGGQFNRSDGGQRQGAASSGAAPGVTGAGAAASGTLPN